jgi:hypothetical protein
MDESKKDAVINHYINKFNILPTQLNPKEREFLESLTEKYELQDIIEAINLLDKRPKSLKNLEKELIKHLKDLSLVKHKEIENNLQTKLQENKETPKPKAKVLNSKSSLPEKWSLLFDKYSIPESIVNFSKLEMLNDYLKNVYLSDLVADYLLKNLPSEKLSKYIKKAEKHFSKINLIESEKEEAYKIYIKYLIKKDLKILF